MELVTAVLGDHGQRPKDDYGMPFFSWLRQIVLREYILFVIISTFRFCDIVYSKLQAITAALFVPVAVQLWSHWLHLFKFTHFASFDGLFRNAYYVSFNFGFCAAVVTAVTELGHGKPKFYSTPEVIAFCRKWRLPTNHVWLFSTRCPSVNFLRGKFLLKSVWLPYLTPHACALLI
jgi:hypothetical protein